MALYGATAVPTSLLTAGEIERGAKMLHELSPERQAEVKAAIKSGEGVTVAQQPASQPQQTPEQTQPEQQAEGPLW